MGLGEGNQDRGDVQPGMEGQPISAAGIGFGQELVSESSAGEAAPAVEVQSGSNSEGVPQGAQAGSEPSDSRELAVVIEVPSVSSNGALAAPSQHFPHSLPKELRLFLAQNGKAHSVRFDKKNRYVLTVGSRLLNNLIRELGQGEGLTLRQSAITDVNHFLQAKAEMAGTSADVWYRIAPIPEGVEIDLGDATHARVRITPGRVEIIDADSETLFFRTPSMQAMVRPAAVGNPLRGI